ncbi:MAG: NAD-dependent epimerase/dehydratase family protein [Actinobacteria bacterium]|nr:NAD-dependent epimerase/dehydratase family protein [Actinomycetota bacterium]MBU1942676.1 NAD-dependent epimerase/dehydratase family protein [Actinomycetota bacterium]MBU2685998.1 NAD-dependent epimerase/dehydratase family protein [Actinomycetota bacterium]
MPEKTVLVTGAGGFVGRYVVRLLTERGYSVKATDLPAVDLTYAAELGAVVEQGDLMRHHFCRSLVEGCDMVIHIAAAFDLSLTREVIESINVGSTRSLALAAARKGAGHFIQYSTCDVYGLKRRSPITEDESKRPDCAYSISKYLSELTALGVMWQEGLPVSIIRPTFVYGPGAVYTARSFMVLPTLLKRYADRIPLPAGGPQINTVHVEDLAEATCAVLEAGPGPGGRAFNVADDSVMTGSELIRRVMEPFGIECAPEVALPWSAIEAVARVASHTPMRLIRALNEFLAGRWDSIAFEHDLVPLLSPRIDRDFLGFLYGEHRYANDRLKSLGWSPRYPTFADGWPATVAWYRENRYIP